MPAGTAPIPAGTKILTVRELTACIQHLLEDAFTCVWVSGEISKPNRHTSGHIYLNLKDNDAQLKAVIWRSTAMRLRFEPKHGLQVVARGRLNIYAPQGEYKLIIDELHPKGLGALELAFQQLKEKLQQRGWFAPERKKRLPTYPRRIGLVTSLTGAAIRDMLQIIPRRWPAVEILVCPVPVQGDGAAAQIAEAIRLLNRLGAVDVLIVGRGGGSLEDLWPFNEEMVAEAIVHSQIPVISAVGHEVDFTIADFVADKRAATPSEACELAVPDINQVLQSLTASAQRLSARLGHRTGWAKEQLNNLALRRVFRQPFDWIRDLEQRLDDRMQRAGRAIQRRLEQARQHAAKEAARLEGLSPLKVLGRGYSLTRKETGAVVRSAEDVQAGDRIVTLLARGRLASRVEEVQPEAPIDG